MSREVVYGVSELEFAAHFWRESRRSRENIGSPLQCADIIQLFQWEERIGS